MRRINVMMFLVHSIFIHDFLDLFLTVSDLNNCIYLKLLHLSPINCKLHHLSTHVQSTHLKHTPGLIPGDSTLIQPAIYLYKCHKTSNNLFIFEVTERVNSSRLMRSAESS